MSRLVSIEIIYSFIVPHQYYINDDEERYGSKIPLKVNTINVTKKSNEEKTQQIYLEMPAVEDNNNASGKYFDNYGGKILRINNYGRKSQKSDN